MNSLGRQRRTEQPVQSCCHIGSNGFKPGKNPVSTWKDSIPSSHETGTGREDYKIHAYMPGSLLLRKNQVTIGPSRSQFETKTYIFSLHTIAFCLGKSVISSF